MNYTFHNHGLTKLPGKLKPFLYIAVSIIICSVGFILSLVNYKIMFLPLLESLIMGFIAGFSMGGLILWMAYSTVKCPEKLILTGNNIDILFSNGKAHHVNVNAILGFSETAKIDDKSGKPYWVVLYIGKSIYSAKQYLLTLDVAAELTTVLNNLNHDYWYNSYNELKRNDSISNNSE